MAVQKDLFDKPWIRNSFGKTFKFLPPNTWTTISLIVAFIAFAVVALDHLYWGILLFVISGMCDFIDGRVARYTGQSSKFGAFWDGTVDRFVDALIVFCVFFLDFSFQPRLIAMLIFILLFAILMPPFIVAYANHRGAVPDPTEKVIWRLSFRAEPLLLLGVCGFLNPVSGTASFIFFLLALLLEVATVVQSIILVYVRSKDYQSQP